MLKNSLITKKPNTPNEMLLQIALLREESRKLNYRLALLTRKHFETTFYILTYMMKLYC